MCGMYKKESTMIEESLKLSQLAKLLIMPLYFLLHFQETILCSVVRAMAPSKCIKWDHLRPEISASMILAFVAWTGVMISTSYFQAHGIRQSNIGVCNKEKLL